MTQDVSAALDKLLEDCLLLKGADLEGQVEEQMDAFLDEWGEQGHQALLTREKSTIQLLDEAKLRLASTNVKLVSIILAVGEPDPDTDLPPAVTTMGPRQHRQLVAQHLLMYAHDIVRFDEQTTIESLNVLPKPRFDDPALVMANATMLLRTAGYFVLNRRDAQSALASSPPEQETFPPLPFRRVWIEMADGNRSVPYMRYRHEDARELEILGVGIHEAEPGTVWDAYVAFQLDDRAEFFFMGMRITPEGPVDRIEDEEGQRLLGAAYDDIRKLTVGGVHLLTARNVPHEPVLLPRPQRRELQRIGIPSPPHIYYVNLAAAGEHDHDRHTGRQYHVRWLVRGHWRHIDSGQRLCTCHQPKRLASWVHPYIKGPPGSPWKGRAVYVSQPTEMMHA